MSHKIKKIEFSTLQGNFAKVALDNYDDYEKWRKAVKEYEDAHPELISGEEAPETEILMEYERRHVKMTTASDRAARHLLDGVNAFARQVETNIKAGLYQDRREANALFMSFAQDLQRQFPNLQDKQKIIQVITQYRSKLTNGEEAEPI